MSTIAPAELVERIWARDATLWTSGDEAKWLGWLDEPMRMRSRIDDLLRFVEDATAPGVIDTFVLLGMGGSSLAPHVLAKTFESESFHVLDTTHPATIRQATLNLDFETTLFVVSSKSGTTLETRCHLDYFWAKAGKRGERFAAITDPGTELADLARERDFLAVFDGEPTIGGRYSALSAFGMVPAALMGIDLERFFERVDEMVEACHGEEGNPGLELGLDLGRGWQDGRDKITINPNTGDFGLWVEQLIAESTGKKRKGLIPAPDESPEGLDRQAPEVRLTAPYELVPLIERARETGCVVTHGLGPRYLHSTGQLHKGGPNKGLFVQVADDPGGEVSIPGRKFGFRRLIRAQAAGDFASLQERGRRIVRVGLEDL